MLSVKYKKDFLSQNRDYRKFLQKSLDHFKAESDARIDSLGMKVPKILRNANITNEK